MITATEARARVDALGTHPILRKFNLEKRELEAMIIEAVEEGRSSCLIPSRTSNAAVNWLKSLGYVIQYEDAHNNIRKVIW